MNHRIIKVIDNVCGDIEYHPERERFYISDGWPPSYIFQAKQVDFRNARDTIPVGRRGLYILDGYVDSIIHPTHYIPGGEGFAIVLDTIDNRIYTMRYDGQTINIRVIDLETNSVIDTIENVKGLDIFWNPINNKIYTQDTMGNILGGHFWI